MGISDYIPKDNQKKMLEDTAKTVYHNALIPAGEKLVADTETKWDDAAFSMFKEFMEDVIDNIHKEDDAE